MKNLFSVPIAHRGLHGEGIPENSMEAFRAAAEAGYAIETDVRLSKDNRLVLLHDDTLSRMTGDPRPVIDCTLEELSALTLKGSAEKIPTLFEFLSEIRGQVPILLEIKNITGVPAAEFIAAIAKAFENYKGEYAIQSFQPLYVGAYKKLCPHVPCGLLTCSKLPLTEFSPPFARVKRHIVTHMSLNFKIKPDFVSFEFHAPSRKMLRFKGAKLCWTVRSPEDEALARTFAGNIIFEGFRPSL